MPLYRFGIAEGVTTEAQRAQIAKEVVRIHCRVTAAPPSFVHAFYSELPEAKLPDGKRVFVLGTIRAGRTTAQKDTIVSQLTGSIAATIGRGPEEVAVVLTDVPSSWNMEGGEVLPEPGEEAAWIERHRQREVVG
jgi:phenylpyruvate tautomerase PptA (4-oxalocrotonate tautomerase family)